MEVKPVPRESYVLTDDEVRLILAQHKGGMYASDIAKLWGRNAHTIQNIVNRRSYRHVQLDGFSALGAEPGGKDGSV